jgi:hypothetical protein
MIWLAGGRFVMGSNLFYREEQPARVASAAGAPMIISTTEELPCHARVRLWITTRW